MNDRPIFILGAHKSGTSLLRNILNGHSQLFTVPIESHFFQNMNYWIDNEYRQQRPQPNSVIQQNFYHFIHQLNSNDNKLGGSYSKNLFKEELFRKKFYNLEMKQPRVVLERYFEAIHYSITSAELPSQKRVVEKSVENAEFAMELKSFYPKAKFVHIVRNPYANFVSLRKFKSIDFGYPIIRRMIKTFYNNFYFLYKNKKLISEYFIVRYEDLVSQPQKYVKQLCEFLEIPFQPILLKPTYRGQTWEGNSMSGQKMSDISSSRLGKWQSEIYPVEVEYINHLFDFVLQDFNYKKIEIRGSFWKKVRGESFARYLANRFYKFYLQEW